jgi:activating signal cointegrator complex subunit 3
MKFAASDEHPRQFLSVSEEDLQMVLSQITDQNLRHTLQFGIGLHHAGLNDHDRSAVEELFTNNKIQVLVSTSTLAWGVNLPAHLVIIKGTEYFDGKTKRYVDFPLTEILQMMGRAGRPQFDQHGKAVILVHEPKKSFYKKVKLSWNYLAIFGIRCNNLPQKDHTSSACSSCTNHSP